MEIKLKRSAFASWKDEEYLREVRVIKRYFDYIVVYKVYPKSGKRHKIDDRKVFNDVEKAYAYSLGTLSNWNCPNQEIERFINEYWESNS